MVDDRKKARQYKEAMKEQGDDFLTTTREELTEFFEIGKLADKRANSLVYDCFLEGLTVCPPPTRFALYWKCV